MRIPIFHRSGADARRQVENQRAFPETAVGVMVDLLFVIRRNYLQECTATSAYSHNFWVLQSHKQNA
jgi:hypothetical protein